MQLVDSAFTKKGYETHTQNVLNEEIKLLNEEI